MLTSYASPMMRAMRMLLLALFALGCNTGMVDGDDDPVLGSGCTGHEQMCAAPANTFEMQLCARCDEPGFTCAQLADCGGAWNAKATTFCEHCLLRPDLAVCEAGICRPLGPTGGIEARFGVPMAANGAKSFTIASVLPTKADGTKMSCATLMSGADLTTDATVNTSNSTFKSFSPEANADFAYTGLISAEVGSGRILFIQITTETQGKGTVVARGCTEDITVTEGENTTVAITIDPV